MADIGGTWIQSAVGVVLGGGIFTGIASLRKLKPEADQILVSTAQNVVLISKDMMDELRQQMKEMQERFDQQVETSQAALKECHSEREELRRQRDEERSNNFELRARVDVLEAEVARLRLKPGMEA